MTDLMQGLLGGGVVGAIAVAIVQALARRNATQAELAMRIHLDSSFEVMAAMYPDKASLFAEGGQNNERARRAGAGGRRE